MPTPCWVTCLPARVSEPPSVGVRRGDVRCGATHPGRQAGHQHYAPGVGPAPGYREVMTDDGPRLIKDAAVLRALAHPARMAILTHLGQGGSVTATECAEL